MTGPLTGKVALVTGGARGIGRAIAHKLATAGCDICITYYNSHAEAEALCADVRGLGRKAMAIQGNAGDPKSVAETFAEFRQEFERLDILVSNAASGYNRPVMEQKPKGWEWTMNINARALLFAAQKCVPLMEKRGGGSIVSITSGGSTRVLPDYVVVGASKAALESLTRYLAVELAPKNIAVNAVSPGVVETDILKHFDIVNKEAGLIEEIIT